MNRPHTLRTIAEGMGREKRTAQLWYQQAKEQHGELGAIVNGTRYFSDEERAILEQYAGVKPAEVQAIAPEIMPENFIQAGELATVETRSIQLPQGFDASAMVRFFDGVTGEATDTSSLVAIADMAINAVESAMDSKLTEQRQKLTQAEQDAKALAEKINASKVKLQVKALESKILAERQTTATQSAEELFAELMNMGKPAADGGSGQE